MSRLGPVFALLLAIPAVSGAQDLRCESTSPSQGIAFPSLYCIDLFSAQGVGAASGIARLRYPGGPFGASVTREGVHRFQVQVEVSGLPPARDLGPFHSFVAWAVTPTFDEIRRLGIVEGDGVFDLGEVAFNKFLILITAEESDSVTRREGRLVLRGQSPGNALRPHDVFSLTPLAAFSPTEPVGHGHPPARHTHGGHLDAESGAAAWEMPPDHPRVPMTPGMTGIAPSVTPYLPSPEGREIPDARPRELIAVAEGDTIRLRAGFVKRRLKGKPLVMLGFNDQYPGPLIYVKERTTIVVDFRNDLPMPSAVHWHGVRLDNPFDGVPGLTQDPVEPGGFFLYSVHFPDAGIYWYHPHHREDIQQDLGLYGNILVQPGDPDYYNQVDGEVILMLDDLLLGEEGIVPFGRESANFMLMGRFGNVFLTNGEPDYSISVDQGAVTRFYLTNVSNTRTFNLDFGARRVKVIASDLGKYERETWAETVVIAPAERYVVEVLFEEPGTFALTNRVQALNHTAGLFFPEIDTVAAILVRPARGRSDAANDYERLRTNEEVVADIDRYRGEFNRSVDRELLMTMRVENLPPVVSQMMRLDPIFFNPVEWSDTMPMMNWIGTGNEVLWVLRDPETGLENMNVEWNFRRGEVARIRVHNDRNAFHAMQHPLHIHGQRFLILERDGVPNENLVWKDTAVIPAGTSMDLLLELSNPGRWMVHCHIAEHLESGMMMVINVTD